ncbi:MAG: arylsulfatase [Verrucomicrobiota bacterium]|nr:arylsulfatase [Verrucomicrobiota bacterium]
MPFFRIKLRRLLCGIFSDVIWIARADSFQVIGVLALVFFQAAEGTVSGAVKSPNIILILADDLGYGDLGSYGQRLFQTPRLDQMAREGIRFKQYYAGSALGASSRSALLTGLHTGHTRIRGNADIPLDYGDFTIAELLKQKNYHTCAIGKWGLGEAGSTGLPNLQGFDEWFGFLNRKNACDHYPEVLWRNQVLTRFEENGNGNKGLYIPYKFTEAAINFIKTPRKHPFFLYLASTLPHQRVVAPTTKPYKDTDWPEPQKMLAAMIYRLDRNVGKILDAVDALPGSRDTMVFFCSDNGPHDRDGVDPRFFKSSGPFRGIKRDLYEGGIRSPMIVRCKGRIQQGVVSDQVWAAWDVFPTIADLADIRPPTGLDGSSMAGSILKGERLPHLPLYWEMHEQGFHQAVRMGRWKGVRHGLDSPLELYDLFIDPGETRDLADAKPDVIRQMTGFMAGARTEVEEWPIP